MKVQAYLCSYASFKASTESVAYKQWVLGVHNTNGTNKNCEKTLH